MENSSGYPPREVLLRAAAWAAWYSGLRGSSLVPVIVTKRKYVTKPKGAPAGSVRVEREEVEMVTPEEPFKRSEEQTSELQSRGHRVCRLLLDKKKITPDEYVANN